MRKTLLIALLLATYIFSYGAAVENPTILLGGRIGYTQVVGVHSDVFFVNIASAKGGDSRIMDFQTLSAERVKRKFCLIY